MNCDSYKPVYPLCQHASSTNNGYPRAIIDGVSITEIRTAAVSGVATQKLARADATILAILGSGVQARSHVEAMLAVRDITVFKSLGIAVEDIVAAHHIYLRAQEKDVGIVYNFEGRSE